MFRFRKPAVILMLAALVWAVIFGTAALTLALLTNR